MDEYAKYGIGLLVMLLGWSLARNVKLWDARLDAVTEAQEEQIEAVRKAIDFCRHYVYRARIASTDTERAIALETVQEFCDAWRREAFPKGALKRKSLTEE